jgi:hypothetical protein
MIPLKNIIGHFNTVCRHKYWVAHYCFKMGLYKQGLLHDLSKFSNEEFWEGAKYYQGDKSPIPICKKRNNGESKAWLHHKGRNKHHCEYWMDCDYDKTPLKPVFNPIPYNYVLEMICDWFAAGRTYKGKKFKFEDEWEWWSNRKKNLAVNSKTEIFINNILKGICQTNKIDRESIRFLCDIYNSTIKQK